MAVDLRPARASDVDALLAIEEAVFSTDRLSRRSFRRLIASPSAAVVVAEVQNEVAGYCVILFRAGTKGARLYSLATAPTHAARGIGQQLMAIAEGETTARQKHYLGLEVREDNHRAISIYERAGFRRTGTRSDYYQDGTTSICMKKPVLRAKESMGEPATPSTGSSFSRAAARTSGRAIL
ncbi:MAG: GNAT family N-acetyltransferase [Rhizobiaceae bacterium]|nr:GNAT family N-acetyltransferase [Rhizobiaceae bacterium]